MTLKVAHVMAKKMIFASADHTIAHARDLMARKRIHALPVVGVDRKALGIVTTADLARRWADDTLVTKAMSTEVVTIKATADVSAVARIMLRKRIHHVLVIAEKKVVGIVSSFDLLRLVEKNAVRHDNQEDSVVGRALL